MPFHATLPESIVGHVGQWIEPVIRPLGFNWKIGIGLLSSILAREVIVGTLGTLYGGRSRDPVAQPAGCAAPRPYPGWRDGAGGLLRLRHAVHLNPGDCAPRDQQLEVAAVQFAYMSVLAYLAALATNQIITHLF